MSMSTERFIEFSLQNPVNAVLLEILHALDLPQAFLTAGCLFQALWNHRSGLLPGNAVKDYDIFYYDDTDLSWEAEDRVIQGVNSACRHLGVAIEVKNQARVHLWYEERFGRAYPKLRSACDGIDRFLVRCTCVGICAASGRVYAPYGLDELWEGRLVPNPVNGDSLRFLEKAQSYRKRWPWLSIVQPDGVDDPGRL